MADACLSSSHKSSIIDHSSIEEWASKSTRLFNVHPKYVEKVRKIISRTDEINEEDYPEPALITSIKQPKFKDKELRVVLELNNGLFVARTFCPVDEVIFLVLDKTQPGKIIFEFSWDLALYWSGFLHRRIYPRYAYSASKDGAKVFIVGPREFQLYSTPSIKILDLLTWNVGEVHFFTKNSADSKPLWPVNFSFVPHTRNPYTVILVASDCGWVHYNQSYCNPGYIIQYNAEKRKFNVHRKNMVQTGFLELLKDGIQFMCILDRRFYGQQTVGIFNSESIDMLFVVHMDLHLKANWDPASTYMIPFYSACCRYLSIVLWGRKAQSTNTTNTNTDINSDVVTFKMDFIGDHLRPLQDWCKSVIISSLSEDAVHKLPLPCQLIKYIELL